jgi:hypothetical protein
MRVEPHIRLPNRRSGESPRRQAPKHVLSHSGAMSAVEFFALSGEQTAQTCANADFGS